jgi:hypothetical protein
MNPIITELLLLILRGGLMLLAGVLGIVALISMMTMMAVAEERGEVDASVKYWRRVQPQVAACLIPVPIIWLLGVHPVFTVPFVLAALVLLSWNLRRVQVRVTVSQVLLGTNEKDPDFFVIQSTRNMLYWTVFVVAATFVGVV